MPENVLEPILNYVVLNNLKLVKLHSTDSYKTEELDIDFNGFKLSKVDKKESNFLMSHQVSIWDKNFLYEQLKNNEHPWRNERKGSKRLKKVSDEIYQVDLLSLDQAKPINKNTPNIEPGGYITVSANACIDIKVKKVISEIKESLPKYAEEIIFHLENNITHDGKEKPRKVDIFKKMKNKYKSLFASTH
jgi:hypothetical protein